MGLYGDLISLWALIQTVSPSVSSLEVSGRQTQVHCVSCSTAARLALIFIICLSRLTWLWTPAVWQSWCRSFESLPLDWNPSGSFFPAVCQHFLLLADALILRCQKFVAFNRLTGTFRVFEQRASTGCLLKEEFTLLLCLERKLGYFIKHLPAHIRLQ